MTTLEPKTPLFRERPARKRRICAFTLVEITIASSILVLAISMAMGGLIFVLRNSRKSNVQGELDIDVQTAMEELKRDLRLSAMDRFFLHPLSGDYQGISFPMCRDDDGDGAVEVDAENRIIWDKTMIYHRWEGTPNQLRLTEFDPRDNTLSDAQRREQLEDVVNDGHGTSTHNGANASTRTVFRNLFDWNIFPADSSYDGYYPVLSRDRDVVLGSCIISNGPHTFTFVTQEPNTNSTGRKIGIDYLFMSPSYSAREGEAQLPVTAESGATATEQYMAGGSWSGNYQLYFPATATGQQFTITMENDRWENTNFRRTGYRADGTTVKFDQSLSPKDYMLMLEGNDTNWYAWRYAGDYTGSASAEDFIRGDAVRVLIRGQQMEEGGYLSFDGEKCKVKFRAGGPDVSRKLGIEDAYIAECANHTNVTADVIGSTMTPISFGGLASKTIDGGSSVLSDEIDFQIDKDKSYIVGYLCKSDAARGNAWKWTDYMIPGRPGSFILTNASSGEFTAPTWSTNARASSTGAVYGVEHLFTSYPSNGTYVSGRFDTHLVEPDYTGIDWNEVVPAGCDLGMKVRSASSSDMSDAVDWDSIAWMYSPGWINPLTTGGMEGRYVQFMALLQTNPDCDDTPKLKDVAIKWEGEPQVVDVGGTFTRGPDYGQFTMLVDGVNLQAGVKIDLEIYEDVLGFRGTTTRVTSALSTEIMPRNTGK
ncbi:MAG: hypothetical protein R6V03_04790 [Kiritimatiellia bacterium]